MNNPRSRSKPSANAFRYCLLVFVGLICSQIALGQQTDASISKDANPRAIAGKAAESSPAVTTTPSDGSVRADPQAILRSAKVIYVRSSSLLVDASVVEDKLQKRSEFDHLGLMITRDEHAADLILELRHDLFTMYVFSVIEPKTQVVVASGKLSSLGGTVAGKVAERFLKRLLQARRTSVSDML